MEKPSTTGGSQPSTPKVNCQSTIEVSPQSTPVVSCQSTPVVSRQSAPEVSLQSAEKDHYQTFLVEQQNRDGKWSANREASRMKKTRVTSDETSDEISVLKQQLQAKERECAFLRDQLRGQERLCKVNTCISNL